MNLFSFLYMHLEFIPKKYIDLLLEHKSQDYANATVNNNNNSYVNPDHRKTKWLSLPDSIHKDLTKNVYLTYENYLKDIFKSQLEDIEPPQMLRYDVGDYYDFHNDSESFENDKLIRIAERDVSLLYYLNDNYTGGELEFTKLNLTIKPKAGMLIAFPSYIDFEHKVHPVTNGIRYNIVSWIKTKKRIYNRPYDNDTSTAVQRTWVLSN